MENEGGVNNNSGKMFPNGGVENGNAVQAAQQVVDKVKEILERNLMLIQEIDQNKEAGNLSRKFALMLELHNNHVRVGELYFGLSSLSLAKGSASNTDTDADVNATKKG
jgi:hypothetical protein